MNKINIEAKKKDTTKCCFVKTIPYQNCPAKVVQGSCISVHSDHQMELGRELVPAMSANIEIALAPNIRKSTVAGDVASAEGDKESALSDLVSSILANTKTLDSGISKFIDQNFWDLI